MALKRIGFYLTWNLGSLTSHQGNVLGDELYGQSLVRALRCADPELDVDLYAPNKLPERPLDIMVYLNDDKPNPGWSSKTVLYLQNAYGEGCDRKLAELRANGYDGYAFISDRLCQLHKNAGQSGIFLPFGVDTSVFYPRQPDSRFAFDVAYVGNDIKGTQRSEAYLEPAADFNFGLYGNWKIGRARLRFWKNWGYPRYKYTFEKLARGKIPQEDVPSLYSSAAINLNCTAQDCVDWDVITLRTLEVLACNGFLISDRVTAAEKIFGEYVVFTDGHNDLREKINYYLNHPTERTGKASAGGAFVRENFSIDATARKLLDYMRTL